MLLKWNEVKNTTFGISGFRDIDSRKSRVQNTAFWQCRYLLPPGASISFASKDLAREFRIDTHKLTITVQTCTPQIGVYSEPPCEIFRCERCRKLEKPYSHLKNLRYLSIDIFRNAPSLALALRVVERYRWTENKHGALCIGKIYFVNPEINT